MELKKSGINTLCTHYGELEDPIYKGAVSPLYMSTSYAFEDVAVKRYPRYFNTPNQVALAKKIAALEHCEASLIFGSGMAAVSTAMLAFLSAGDHVVLQKTLYGGTYNFVVEELARFGISYTFTKGLAPNDFEAALQDNTKVIYIETPSNPLLTITDLKAVGVIAKKAGIVSMIDNTFASPVNQNPADFGIDVIIHSATKYMGGHSDICAGAVAASQAHIDQVFRLAKNFGGSLSDYTVWLLERSIKTMGIRVKAQNENAMEMATYLEAHPEVSKVYYPGLKSHPDHELAAAQMSGFGGMVSFTFKSGKKEDAVSFLEKLKVFTLAESLGGVESLANHPALMTHASIPEDKRKEIGITDDLVRLSTGVEDIDDLLADLEQAFR